MFIEVQILLNITESTLINTFIYTNKTKIISAGYHRLQWLDSHH